MTGRIAARQGTYLGLSRGGWAWVTIVLVLLAAVTIVIAITAINGSHTDARLCDATEAMVTQYTSDRNLARESSRDTNLPKTSRDRSAQRVVTLNHTITTLQALKKAAC